MKLRRSFVLRGLLSAAACAGVIATSIALGSAQSTNAQRLQREAVACSGIGYLPHPSAGAFEAISMPRSVLSTLEESGNRSLEHVARDFDKAAIAENSDAMISALDDGVKVCHRLHLRTAS